MRDVPAGMTTIWRNGDFSGDNRPIARVTVQQANIKLYRRGHNTWSSLPFGMGEEHLPKELPNVKSVSWDRDVDSDVAEATIVLWNTKPLPLGEVPTSADFDLPGWYTPTRGRARNSRWGHTENEWSGLLMPDNVIKTYEGYGFDADVCPDKDPNLVQTGAWIIDDVRLSASGLITLKCRDFGRLLLDHIAMQPVIPDAFYPLTFHAIPKRSGIRPPQIIDRDDNYTGSGPTAPPTGVVVEPGDGEATVSWDPMPPVEPDQPLPAEYEGGTAYKTDTGKYYLRMPDENWYRCTGPGQVAGVEYLYGPWVEITEDQVGRVVTSVVQFFGGPGGIEQYTPRYENVGFRIYHNGVLTGIGADENTLSVVLPRLLNGALAYVEVAAIYQELNTGLRYTTDERSERVFFSPRTSDAVAVDPFSVTTDVRADGTPEDRWVSWDYVGDGREVTWKVIVYAPDEDIRTFTKTEVVADGPGTAEVKTNESSLQHWSVVVWPMWPTNEVGPGGWVGDTTGEIIGKFYGTPAEAGTPPDPPDAEGRAAYTGTTSSGETITTPATSVEVPLSFSGSSNTPYVGLNGAVYGHTGGHAFDDDIHSYWLSVGNSRPDAPYAYEWIEGKCNPSSIFEVGCRLPSLYTNVLCYVSIFADGKWVAPDPGNVVPYDPNHGASAPNGANIPFWTATVLNHSGVTQSLKIPLGRVIPNVTKVRLCFYNLRDSNLGTYQYRMGVAEVYASAEGESTTTTTTTERDASTPEGSTVMDSNGSLILNARFIGGAGDKPGKYEDYTDIVKLLCAWGGFYWHDNSKIYSCDGSFETFSFGPAPYNLGPNIDPVLGVRNNQGRVWGDFEVAGVAGVSDLTPQLFDKKPLMDGIAHVRDILGFLFYIDEEGAVVFRSPNIYSVGNWVLNRSGNAGRTPDMVVIDELQTIMDLTATLSSRNMRERVFIATPDAKKAGTAKGINPNPAGWRRVAGWTDQNFASKEECQVMADMITLRQMFTYRGDSVTIPGYPRIQINDQVRINERVTSESYIHYVKSISSSLDMETGEWTYQLGTHWLGERPFDRWAFDSSDLLYATVRYLQEVRGIDFSTTTKPPKSIEDTHEFPEYEA